MRTVRIARWAATLLVAVSTGLLATATRGQTQEELDAACEAAREVELAPLRQELVDECVAKEGKPQAECEAEYAQWNGGRGGGVSARFYDLPECVTAFEHEKSAGQ